jgi:hypothetical protein
VQPSQLHSDQHDVDPAWFDQQKRRSVQGNDSSPRDWLATEVSALKVFHDAHLDADEAALCMIHPLSTSPVPALGGCSDHTLALSNLWRIVIAALIEWLSARALEIFTLLTAIAKALGNIHKGQALNDKGELLTWASFPYSGMIWHENTSADIQPGQTCRQYLDTNLGALQARDLYLRMKDIKAQLVAKHVLIVNKAMIQLIVRALKTEIDQSDERLATDGATGYSQVKLDFHIPAINFSPPRALVLWKLRPSFTYHVLGRMVVIDRCQPRMSFLSMSNSLHPGGNL